MSNKEYLCALDIEALGHVNSCGAFSVGFCYGTTWEDRKKIRFTFAPKSYHRFHPKYGTPYILKDDEKINWEDIIEPVTWAEFWSKNTDVLNVLASEFTEFKYLSEFVKELYSVGTKVTFLGDNPAYDFSHLAYEFEAHDELPIRFSNRLKLSEMQKMFAAGDPLPSDGYHGIKDPSERIKYYHSPDTLNQIVKKLTSHSHLPDDDAEGIYLSYLLMKDLSLFNKLSMHR